MSVFLALERLGDFAAALFEQADERLPATVEWEVRLKYEPSSHRRRVVELAVYRGAESARTLYYEQMIERGEVGWPVVIEQGIASVREKLRLNQ